MLAFLKRHVEVRIGNAEWPACLDLMTQTEFRWNAAPFTEET